MPPPAPPEPLGAGVVLLLVGTVFVGMPVGPGVPVGAVPVGVPVGPGVPVGAVPVGAVPVGMSVDPGTVELGDVFGVVAVSDGDGSASGFDSSASAQPTSRAHAATKLREVT